MNKSIITSLAIVTVVLAAVLVGSLWMRSKSSSTTPVPTVTTTNTSNKTVDKNEAVTSSSNTNTSVEILDENVETSVKIAE